MTVSLKASEARELEARLADVVRELKAARAAGKRERVQELELEELELLEATSEPMTTTEEQYRERRAASGIDDGVDTSPIRRAPVRDVFNPQGWFRPRANRLRRPHARRSRRSRSRRLAGSRSSSKDPPSDEPELARRLFGSSRCWLDATGIWPWSGWQRLAAEALAEREIQYFRAVAREAGFTHLSEPLEAELARLGGPR